MNNKLQWRDLKVLHIYKFIANPSGTVYYGRVEKISNMGTSDVKIQASYYTNSDFFGTTYTHFRRGQYEPYSTTSEEDKNFRASESKAGHSPKAPISDKINHEDLKVGIIYKFKGTIIYIGRVKEITASGVDTSCYISENDSDCLNGGDFNKFIYTYHIVSTEEMLNFKKVETKNDITGGIGKSLKDYFEVGEIVEYTGYTEGVAKTDQYQSHISCCYKAGEHLKIKYIDEDNCGSVSVFTHINDHSPDQTVSLDQIKKLDVKDVPCKFKIEEFPREGWCRDAKSELGHFLADKFDSGIQQPGTLGYAWNSTGYWTIAGDSSKIEYAYKDLTHFISEKFGSSFEKEEEDKEEAELPLVDGCEKIPDAPKMFNTNDHVKLLKGSGGAVKPFVGLVGLVINDCGHSVEVEFRREDGIPVRAMIFYEHLEKTPKHITNSLEDKIREREEMAKSRYAAELAHDWTIHDHLSIHRGNIGSEFERELNRMGNNPKYNRGCGPHSHHKTMPKLGTYDNPHPVKVKSEAIRGPTIVDRVVKPRHVPDEPDKFVKENPELIVKLEPIKDRTIKVKVKVN